MRGSFGSQVGVGCNRMPFSLRRRCRFAAEPLADESGYKANNVPASNKTVPGVSFTLAGITTWVSDDMLTVV